MRVLHFIDSLRVGGKERQLVELVKAITQHSKIEQLLVCMGEDDFYEPEVRKLPVQVKYLIRNMRWDPAIFYRLYHIVKEFRPAIIHTNSWMTSFYALPVARIFKVKLINGSIRNAYSCGGIRWRLEKWILSLSDYRVANSEAGLLSRGFTADYRRNFVIYNGFDWCRLQRIGQAGATQGIPSNNLKIVGKVAEFSDSKDYTTYVLAAKEVLRKRNDVRFVAVGDGKNFELYKNMVEDCRERIQLIGKVRNVEEYVACFDIGVLATYTEGISNSIMEYMALGKPVIATDGGGTREIVVDEVTGILVPPGEPGILASKIEYLLDNPDVARRMGEAGRKRLEEYFSLKEVAEKTINLYELALSRQSA